MRSIFDHKKPLITVGLITFNAEDTVERAIISAQQQDWDNLEILIIDDHSSDNTCSLIDNFSTHDQRIRFIRQPENRGVAAARNRIIQEARGKFIVYFDDDDESTNDRLMKQYERITQFEEEIKTTNILCYSNRSVVKRNAKEIDHVAKGIGYSNPEPWGEIVACNLFGFAESSSFKWGMLGTCTMMARRDTLLNLGGFDEDFRRCAEWDLAIRAAFEKTHFISVNKPLVIQYKTATSDKSGVIPLRYSLKVRHKHKKYLMERKVYLSSIFYAYSNFYGNKKRIHISRFFRALALMFLPVSLKLEKFRSFFNNRYRGIPSGQNH